MADEFWSTGDEWAAIEPLVPMNRPGVKPQNDRRIISGISHVSKSGCRGRDCPALFGPHTTVCNAFLGFEASPSFVRRPEGNGVAERFIRTPTENLLRVPPRRPHPSAPALGSGPNRSVR